MKVVMVRGTHPVTFEQDGPVEINKDKTHSVVCINKNSGLYSYMKLTTRTCKRCAIIIYDFVNDKYPLGSVRRVGWGWPS